MDSISNNPARVAIPFQAKAARSEAKVPSSSEAVESKETADVTSYLDQLSDMKDVRPDAVKRGLALLENPNWPDDAILESVASGLISQFDER